MVGEELLSVEGIVARLRRRLFSAVLNQEVAFFDSMRTGVMLAHR